MWVRPPDESRAQRADRSSLSAGVRWGCRPASGDRGCAVLGRLLLDSEIRPPSADELARLPELERRADGMYATVGIDLDAPVAEIEELRAARQVLVIGRPPAGFARIDDHGGQAHLEQLSVDPTQVRRGLGGRLLEAACAWAADAGYDSITLMTFRDVPFNGPFYARHGFAEVPVPSQLDAVVAEDRRLGLDRLGVRVIMRRALGVPGSR